MVSDKIIATDLDGTLLYPKEKFKILPDKTKEFLRKYHDDGGRLLVVSSRTSYMTNKISKALGFGIDSIGCNGAFVRIGDKVVYENCFKPDEIKEIINYLKVTLKCKLILLSTKNYDLVSNSSRIPHYVNIFYSIYQTLQFGYKEPFIKSDFKFFDEIAKGNVYKAMCLVGITKNKKKIAMEANKVLRERFPNAEFAWLGEFIEITPKEASKGKGVSFYLDYLGISKDNILVVGDNGNDISMFEAFKNNSFCMDHGDEHVKKHAKHIIKRFSDLEDYLYPSEDKITPKKEGKDD